ncbi:hypothetical protein CDD80_1987 [Ophiocordyceps camponoti-rufipedis]|uniref:Uncharacterized protein n=1 Tax=Ophiocordyceps camponoti-rufipedis TaxID=2004952 RepID=A0A2C5Z9R5_9HYPO|nr:hypothetical protein CDD80_1987 [Ophiocordyceps camponoti-rufipedis]
MKLFSVALLALFTSAMASPITGDGLVARQAVPGNTAETPGKSQNPGEDVKKDEPKQISDKDIRTGTNGTSDGDAVMNVDGEVKPYNKATLDEMEKIKNAGGQQRQQGQQEQSGQKGGQQGQQGEPVQQGEQKGQPERQQGQQEPQKQVELN